MDPQQSLPVRHSVSLLPPPLLFHEVSKLSLASILFLPIIPRHKGNKGLLFHWAFGLFSSTGNQLFQGCHFPITVIQKASWKQPVMALNWGGPCSSFNEEITGERDCVYRELGWPGKLLSSRMVCMCVVFCKWEIAKKFCLICLVSTGGKDASILYMANICYMYTSISQTIAAGIM